jgi:hypothetical protein
MSLATQILDANSVRLWETPVRALINAAATAAAQDPAVAAALVLLQDNGIFTGLPLASDADIPAKIALLQQDAEFMAALDLVTSTLIENLS